MIWDQHAQAGGIASLFLCIIGGIVYEQAPMQKLPPADTVTAEDEAFKDNVSVDAHRSDEEIDLIERQGSNTSEVKRRGWISRWCFDLLNDI